MPEARETAPPESVVAAPTHTMSETGSARLAALSPAEREGGTVEDLRPPVEKVDEVAPAEETPPSDPQSERVTPRPEVDASGIPPLAVSDRYRADAEGYRADAALIAREHNIPVGEVSAIYEFVGSAVAAELATAASDATSFGQVPGADLANPDACRQVLRTKYGDMANALMDTAAREFASLPADVRAWIDHDHGDGRKLGNSPALVEGLALRPFARLSHEAAQAELNRIRNSKEYTAGDRLAVSKARMLSIVLSRPAAASAPQPGTRGIVYPKPGNTWGSRDAALPTQGTDAAKALRAELTALSKSLYDQKGELSRNPEKRKRAVARRAEIQTQLGGQG
jgi:hypothetical protein